MCVIKKSLHGKWEKNLPENLVGVVLKISELVSRKPARENTGHDELPTQTSCSISMETPWNLQVHLHQVWSPPILVSNWMIPARLWEVHQFCKFLGEFPWKSRRIIDQKFQSAHGIILGNIATEIPPVFLANFTRWWISMAMLVDRNVNSNNHPIWYVC